MRAITKWEAADGSEWSTPEDAQAREDLIRDVEAIASRLGLTPRPDDGTDFINGTGHLQQPRGSANAIRAELRVRGWHRDSHGPIGDLGYRVMCFDDQDREWGQPYFAANPDKAYSDRCLNA